MIKETTSMRYRIMIDGETLNECPSLEIANKLLLDLPKELQETARIVPVTNEGKEFLIESRSFI